MSISVIAAPATRGAQAIVGLLKGGDIAALTQTQTLPEALKVQTKVRLKVDDDEKRVVKLSDAIQCVEDAMNGQTLAVSISKRLVDLLVGLKGAENLGNLIGDPIAQCIRSKALPQNSPRRRVTYRYAKRAI